VTKADFDPSDDSSAWLAAMACPLRLHGCHGGPNWWSVQSTTAAGWTGLRTRCRRSFQTCTTAVVRRRFPCGGSVVHFGGAWPQWLTGFRAWGGPLSCCDALWFSHARSKRLCAVLPSRVLRRNGRDRRGGCREPCGGIFGLKKCAAVMSCVEPRIRTVCIIRRRLTVLQCGATRSNICK